MTPRLSPPRLAGPLLAALAALCFVFSPGCERKTGAIGKLQSIIGQFYSTRKCTIHLIMFTQLMTYMSKISPGHLYLLYN